MKGDTSVLLGVKGLNNNKQIDVQKKNSLDLLSLGGRGIIIFFKSFNIFSCDGEGMLRPAIKQSYSNRSAF